MNDDRPMIKEHRDDAVVVWEVLLRARLPVPSGDPEECERLIAEARRLAMAACDTRPRDEQIERWTGYVAFALDLIRHAYVEASDAGRVRELADALRREADAIDIRTST